MYLAIDASAFSGKVSRSFAGCDAERLAEALVCGAENGVV